MTTVKTRLETYLIPGETLIPGDPPLNLTRTTQTYLIPGETLIPGGKGKGAFHPGIGYASNLCYTQSTCWAHRITQVFHFLYKRDHIFVVDISQNK